MSGKFQPGHIAAPGKEIRAFVKEFQRRKRRLLPMAASITHGGKC